MDDTVKDSLKNSATNSGLIVLDNIYKFSYFFEKQEAKKLGHKSLPFKSSCKGITVISHK